jgi:hypothetical protein
MSLKKGFFRLTLVLSISIGIVSSFVMIQREPYTRFKVKRTGGAKELVVTLLLHEEREPDIFDFVDAFQKAEKMNKTIIEVNPFARIVREQHGKSDKLDEVAREPRTLREAIKGIAEKLEKEQKLKEQKASEDFTIVEKTVRPIKWNRFFLIMGIGFTSVWFIYAFIRWVIVCFVIGGFKSKANQ